MASVDTNEVGDPGPDPGENEPMAITESAPPAAPPAAPAGKPKGRPPGRPKAAKPKGTAKGIPKVPTGKPPGRPPKTAPKPPREPGKPAKAQAPNLQNVRRVKPQPTSLMSGDLARKLANKLKMAADPTRLRVLVDLDAGPLNVTDLVKRLGMTTQPAISHHLALLRHSGIVEPSRLGKNNIYGLTHAGKLLMSGLAALVRDER